MKFLAMDRHHWPRYSYGRDALGRDSQCQLPDGSDHDQGGGTGVQALGQLPVKPWMANMATNPMFDYLERWPADPARLERKIRRTFPSRPQHSLLLRRFPRGEYFLRVDGGPSTVNYGSSYAELVRQYGEEDAKYVWEQMHPPALENTQTKAVFINLPATTPTEYLQRFQEKATAAGKECVQLEGSLRLIDNFLRSEWDAQELLIVPPGQKTAGVYDWNEVIRAAPPAGSA